MNKKGSIFIISGAVAIILAVVLTGYNHYSAVTAEKKASAAAKQMIEFISEAKKEFEDIGFVPDYILNPEMNMPKKELDGFYYVGIIEVPSLGLSLPVTDELTVSSLKVSPGRYKGTAYMDNLIIAAHNYSSHFSNLRELNPGDVIKFTDINGNEFNYEVAFTETLEPTDIEEMESGEWDLTLFTCTFGGQYRITVRCDRITK